MSSNGNKWDRNQILTLIGVIIAAATLVASVVIPEMRNCFGLKDGNTPAPVLPAPTPQPEPKAISPKIETPPAKPAALKPSVFHKAKEADGPQECTIGENKSQRIEEAETDLSIIFNEEYKIVTLTISPDGKEQITLPTVGSGSKEFASSTGTFQLHILNVDWNSRTITVQVSRKSS